jgi:hypothetical protein
MDLSRWVSVGWGGVVKAVLKEDLILDVSSAENNLDSPPGTIDLHGLYVKEGETTLSFTPSPFPLRTNAICT